jgi:uncharacterized protein YecT (DUF1311 family)
MLRRALWAGICLCALPAVAVRAAEVKAGCWDKAQTQVEMNACAGEEYKAADAELNRVYQAVLKKYKDDAKFVTKLRAAQRAWVAYRDAEVEAKFPHGDESRAKEYYGSVLPMCDAQFRAQLTQDRIDQLREWLDGAEEGDICSGSVEIKSEP